PQRTGETGTRSDADEDAFLASEIAGTLHRLVVRYRQDAAYQMHVDRISSQLRDEIRSPALHRMRLERRMARRRGTVRVALLGAPVAEQRCVLGFANDDRRFRSFFRQ